MLLVKQISELQSKKQVTVERQKYQVDDQKLENNIITLKEDILGLNNNLNVVNKELEDYTKDLNIKNLEKIDLSKRLQQLDKDRTFNQNNLNLLNKELLQIKNKIDIINDNLNNDTKLPFAVKSLINNIRLTGIHGVLSKLLEVDDKYSIAIEIALGANANVVVVDDENEAKKAINYLKENKLGRATFFPLNIIKGRYLDKEVINKIVNDKGYIGIASDLLKYDNKYRNIISNLLGNVLVVDNIDSMNRIGKLVDYKYRIVTLEGDILYSGGAISGGIAKTSRGIITEKKELEDLNNSLVMKQNEFDELTNTINLLNKSYAEIEEKYTNLVRNISIIEANIEQKNKYVLELKDNIKNKEQELEGTKNISKNALDKELDTILEQYYEVNNNKELIEKELTKLKSNKFDLVNKINEYEKKYRDFNSEYNSKQNSLKGEEIKLGKMDVKLDNLLLNLNEIYGMTYERAKEEYILDGDSEVIRLEVNNLKAKIRDLGEVNTGSISEYERLNNRYTFLVNQRTDLEESIDSLLSIIEEMDEIMKVNFVETFEKIKVEFSNVFKTLFKGGEAILELTDPDNILETGVEISALPPGKRLNSIALLSGGEKTLTAISLLFAILNVKPVPFVVLDEVEAALDEINVDTFGKYLETKKDRSQFVVITHKKKTMEYADALYGITMQESGVSKLVSVRLEDK